MSTRTYGSPQPDDGPAINDPIERWIVEKKTPQNTPASKEWIPWTRPRTRFSHAGLPDEAHVGICTRISSAMPYSSLDVSSNLVKQNVNLTVSYMNWRSIFMKGNAYSSLRIGLRRKCRVFAAKTDGPARTVASKISPSRTIRTRTLFPFTRSPRRIARFRSVSVKTRVAL